MTTIRVLIVVLLQTLALISIVAERAYTWSSGRVITLKVIPVDPTDMFRGDYVILDYELSTIDLSKVEGADEFERNAPVYVVLTQREGAWTPIAVQPKMPAASAGDIVIRGLAQSAVAAPGTLRVTYGIESFFVPQGKGKPIEDERQKDKVTVDVAIDSSGRAVIKTLKVDGQAVHEETLF